MRGFSLGEIRVLELRRDESKRANGLRYNSPGC